MTLWTGKQPPAATLTPRSSHSRGARTSHPPSLSSVAVFPYSAGSVSSLARSCLLSVSRVLPGQLLCLCSPPRPHPGHCPCLPGQQPPGQAHSSPKVRSPCSSLGNLKKQGSKHSGPQTLPTCSHARRPAMSCSTVQTLPHASPRPAFLACPPGQLAWLPRGPYARPTVALCKYWSLDFMLEVGEEGALKAGGRTLTGVMGSS